MADNTYYLVTLGCQMNKHDSERLAGVLEESGYAGAPDPEHAGLVVFNTCCVREHAENRFYSLADRLRGPKSSRPGMVIAVTGCVAQKERRRLAERLPHVDLVVGVQRIADLPRLVAEVRESEGFRDLTSAEPGTGLWSLPTRRESPVHGWVTIMSGCNNHCSYCIVPHVRGPEVCRPASEIRDEVARLVADGVREVTLLGQNVDSYQDPGKALDFAYLLYELDRIDGIERIRFTTSHPRDFDEEVVAAVRDLDSVCEHVHLPVQAGSSRVLAAMNRGYTKGEYLAKAKLLRAEVPGASLTTDIMVGFPGEEREDFEETLDLVRQAEFDQAFTFIYSPRAGTPSAEWPDSVPHEEKVRRYEELLSVQGEVSARRNVALVGRTLEVVTEGPDVRAEKWTGRTRCNRLVHFAPYDPATDLIHKKARVSIDEGRASYLLGTLIRGPHADGKRLEA